MSKKLIGFTFLVIWAFSCSEETIIADGTISGQEYFPLEVGRTWIYASDSIVFDESMARIDTLSGFLREIISEQLEDGSYVIERSFKREFNQAWQVTDVWNARMEDTYVVRVEENIPFIRLVFPPNMNTSWNGNALFDNSIEIVVAGEPLEPYYNWEYKIVENEELISLDTLNFENVITVSEVDLDDEFLERRFSEAKYAPDVGLIQRKMEILDCDGSGRQDCPEGIPWSERANRGFIFTQSLIAYQ